MPEDLRPTDVSYLVIKLLNNADADSWRSVAIDVEG